MSDRYVFTQWVSYFKFPTDLLVTWLDTQQIVSYNLDKRRKSVSIDDSDDTSQRVVVGYMLIGLQALYVHKS